MDQRAKKTGKAGGEVKAKHVRLYAWLTKTEAWRDLDPAARCAYIELSMRYFGGEDEGRWSTNGRISIGVRQLAEAINVSISTAARSLASLEAHGFIVTMQKGSFNRKVRHATEYRLTEHVCGITGSLPTKDFARWRKNSVSPVTPTVSPMTPIGITGDTRQAIKGLKNTHVGITGDTVATGLGVTGETHISYQGIASARDASASAVAGASDAGGANRNQKSPDFPSNDARSKAA